MFNAVTILWALFRIPLPSYANITYAPFRSGATLCKQLSQKWTYVILNTTAEDPVSESRATSLDSLLVPGAPPEKVIAMPLTIKSSLISRSYRNRKEVYWKLQQYETMQIKFLNISISSDYIIILSEYSPQICKSILVL